MATSLGHSLAGYVVYRCSGKTKIPERFILMIICIVMANTPDLDFLPGILIGQPALYHQGLTHSLGFAVMASLGIAGIFSFKKKMFSVVFKVCFLSYASHLVIDIFGPDGRLPYGIPLFWPISGAHVISPVQLFPGAHHASSTSASLQEWLYGVFSLHNLGAIAIEIIIIVPFLFLGQLYRRRPRFLRAR